MIQQTINQFPPMGINQMGPPAVNPTSRIIEQYYGPASPTSSDDQSEVSKLEKELKLTLALLMKHRGGAGLGHGRLKGHELQLLAEKLQLVSQQLEADLP
jgi:hypothetical protein